ncbi:neprilysin-2-like [Leptopilina heterotoma]|uniref:neprilysin-2-like n=1 Tax=Leptopilina heterotoma TaxID=63436 RepID=UPI001CA97BDF|nr:neprilysin-2-like [Leptopilina heterotoma]
MLNSEEENSDRCRRRLGLKHGLIVLCLVVFVNLSEAQNYNSQYNFNLNLSPYPLSKTINGSIPEINGVQKISDDTTKYCIKPECIHTASRVMNYMDESLDPCDNFYKFACGQYMRKQVLSNDNIFIKNNFISIDKEIKQKMKNILEQDLKPTDAKYVKLIKTFYHNCMNTTFDEKELNSKVTVDLITKINGWSYLKKSHMKNESFHWEKYQLKIIKESSILSTAFFKVNLILDTKNNSNIVLRLEQPSDLTASISDFSGLKYFLPELIKRKVPFEDVIKKINEIDSMLINMSIPENDRQSHIYDRITVKELEGNYSNILWREIFNGILQPSTEVRDDDIVLVSDSSFFKKFNEHINNISKRDQAMYVIWTFVKDILNDNSEVNLSEIKEKWGKCFILTRKVFLSNLGTLYVKNYVNEESYNKHVEELMNNIFHQFYIIIKNVDWLDQKTKDYALEKLSLLHAERQSNFQISDDNEIDEFFKDLEITADDFDQSILNITKFEHKLLSSSFRVPVNRSSMLFREDATHVNAFNVINKNSFSIPPGIFQGIFFNESRPMYMNYGAIGSIVGHEFTHGFDSQGKHYDKNGNLNDWWEPTSQKQFATKAQCFISQYGNYTVEDVNLNVNGIKTQDENIADNVGLKIAYLAYQKWVKDHSSEQMLPGLNYTQSQLFWISFAQGYCEKVTPKVQKLLLNQDVHSPKEFRVIGSLANRPEFAKDFQCPLGSKMNPKTKCSVY